MQDSSLKKCQLPSPGLLGLAHLRKSESVSGHVPVLFICCEYHFLDAINGTK